MLVTGRDILQLDAFRADELPGRGGIVDLYAVRTDKLHHQAGFFLDLA